MQRDKIIERFFASLAELEQAIEHAKETLAEKEIVPQEILERLHSYDDILAKQGSLAKTLCKHIENDDWEEVSRHIALINGLSGLIRDDARDILSALTPDDQQYSDTEESEHL